MDAWTQGKLVIGMNLKSENDKSRYATDTINAILGGMQVQNYSKM